jgi:hypothetical protein
MAVTNINLSCNLQEAVKVNYICGNLYSDDSQGNSITVRVFDGTEPATVSGTVKVRAMRSDGVTVTGTGGTISGNVVTITLPVNALTVPGVVNISVYIVLSGVITTIASVVADVYKS